MSVASMLSDEQRRISKEIQRRRVYIMFFVLGILATISTLAEESDMLLHALDDYTVIAVGVVGVALVLMSRKDQTLASLTRYNRYLMILAVVGFLSVLFGITQEYSDPTDFANDPGQFSFLLALIINRFL